MDDRDYWALMGRESQALNAIDVWNQHYLESCNLPEAEPETTIADLWAESHGTAVEHETFTDARRKVKERPMSQELNDVIAASLPPAQRPRNCEKCGLSLPVNSPRSKRFHDHCSKSTRMQRYREKKRAEKLKQELRDKGHLQDKPST